MPSLGTLKLIGYGVAALAIIGLIAMVNSWRIERNQLREWQSIVLVATKDASANPKLNKKDVAQQIRNLGAAIVDLKAGLAKQNAAVNALAAESDRQKAQASEAVLKAQGRAQAAQATADRLAASSRAGEAQAKPCDPSKVLSGAWQ